MDELHESERGATATEYAILVGFIALVIVVGVAAFGVALEVYYQGVVASVKATLNIP